jgi:hypothetical protein
MLNFTETGSNVVNIHNQRCRMTYRPLSHNERVKINEALDARNAYVGIEDVLMQSYEWTGRKEDRPAFDVFLESEKEFFDSMKNKAPNEKPYSEMTSLESMNKLNEVLGEGENVWMSSYEFYYGNPAPLNPVARKLRVMFFNSRASRLEALKHHIASGDIKDVDDAKEIKLFFERSAFKFNLIGEEKAALIRAEPTPKFL